MGRLRLSASNATRGRICHPSGQYTIIALFTPHSNTCLHLHVSSTLNEYFVYNTPLIIILKRCHKILSALREGFPTWHVVQKVTQLIVQVSANARPPSAYDS